jgi:hypothetical protein
MWFGSRHEKHSCSHGESQHTPLTQKAPGEQSAAPWHNATFAGMAGAPAPASPSETGGQSGVAAVVQRPVIGLQTLAWHAEGAGQILGLPPVQTPAWQISVSVQALPSSQGRPLSGLQIPSDAAPAATEQASQGPISQAVMQQTPSAQKPVWHSPGWTHEAPAGSELKSSALDMGGSRGPFLPPANST